MKENRNSEAELTRHGLLGQEKKTARLQFAREDELESESTSSNNFIPTSNSIMSTGSLIPTSDSIMSNNDEAKTDLEYPKTCSSDVPSTTSSIGISSEFSMSSDFSPYSSESKSSTNPETNSSDALSTSLASSIGISSEFSLYSETKSSINSSSSEPESLSIDRQPNCPRYKGKTKDFGSHLDFSLLEYGNNDIDQQCIDKELEKLLYFNKVAPSSNYVLSSGRWSVNQDGEVKKLTIDKEFEQNFSVLMH